MTEPVQNNLDTLIGKLIVQQGLATPDEVRGCLKSLREAPTTQPGLGDLLVTHGIITRAQLDRLKAQLAEQPTNVQVPGFQVIKTLGAGAMATVYLAKQLSLDRMVAIKVLPKKYSDNTQFVDRFYAEGRAAARLNHNNIVGALDVGRAGPFHYFVMEYVEGKTLLDDLTKQKRYNEPEALGIVIQIAKALDHAHKAGMIHRDVKPKNIMITPTGTAKLADMGLARMYSDREAAEAELGKAFGTPYYISPEQIRGEIDIDGRADIYCLGATFYHIVTGQVPYDGPNPSAVMQMHLKNDLVPPDHINPRLSAGVGEIIEVCMAKDRAQRYQNAALLLEDLQAVAQGDPPMIARHRFDIAVLAEVEPRSSADSPAPSSPFDKNPTPSAQLQNNPWFWVAVGGWAIVGVILLLWLAMR